MNIVFFLKETINGENPTTSSEIESTPKVKPQNSTMTELTTMLGFIQEHSSSFYRQANGQVEAINKTLKTILKRTINASRSDWHIMLYPELWAHRTNVKTATGFPPFQLVHGVEAVTPIECEIPSLRIAILVLPDTTELEECLVQLEHLDEQRRDAPPANQAHKNRFKIQYDKSVKPQIFSKGELVLLWDQDKEPLEAGKFRSMWLGPYFVSKLLKKYDMN